MFCAACGAEDRTRSQFCRSCGAELHAVRAAMENPEPLTRAGAAAREEIGRAIAAKIEEIHNASDLRRVVQDVLPRVEKFLESAVDRRLRHIREGIITSSVGVGVILFFLLISVITGTPEVMIAGGAGIIVLAIGLGILLSAMAHGPAAKRPAAPPPRALDTGEQLHAYLQPIAPPSRIPGIASVTEGTTRQLEKED